MVRHLAGPEAQHGMKRCHWVVISLLLVLLALAFLEYLAPQVYQRGGDALKLVKIGGMFSLLIVAILCGPIRKRRISGDRGEP